MRIPLVYNVSAIHEKDPDSEYIMEKAEDAVGNNCRKMSKIVD